MSKEELDLVSTEDLANALARRADAIVVHMCFELDNNRTSSQPLFAGNIHTCYGLAYDLVGEIEIAIAAQRETKAVTHDDDNEAPASETDDEDDDGEGWKKGEGAEV